MSRARPKRREPEATSPVDEPVSLTGEPRYSIRVTSLLTSIELDTLRVWERRYGFPRPGRTSGGSRTYSASEVADLKLIRRALDHGYRPGEVVGKPGAELARLVLAPGEARAPTRPLAGIPTLPLLLDALRRDDAPALRTALRRSAAILGPKDFLAEVAHPLSVRVGELWENGGLEVRHEHLLSQCLSAQLSVLASAYDARPGAPRVLLATLPGERHGLGLEMVQVYLAATHVTPVLLGVETPAEQIVKAARSHRADAVGVLVTGAFDLAVAAREVKWLIAELPRRVSLWIGGSAGPELPVDPGDVRVVATWGDLDDAILALSEGARGVDAAQAGAAP